MQNRTFTFLAGAYLTLLIIVPGTVAADVCVPASPLAQKLIDQVDRVYLKPKGLSTCIRHSITTSRALPPISALPCMDRNPT